MDVIGAMSRDGKWAAEVRFLGTARSRCCTYLNDLKTDSDSLLQRSLVQRTSEAIFHGPVRKDRTANRSISRSGSQECRLREPSISGPPTSIQVIARRLRGHNLPLASDQGCSRQSFLRPSSAVEMLLRTPLIVSLARRGSVSGIRTRKYTAVIHNNAAVSHATSEALSA